MTADIEACFAQRIAALICDTVIAALATFLNAWVLFIFVFAQETPRGYWALLMLPIFVGLFVEASRGRGIGMAVAGVKVVRIDGAEASTVAHWMRAAIKATPAIILAVGAAVDTEKSLGISLLCAGVAILAGILDSLVNSIRGRRSFLDSISGTALIESELRQDSRRSKAA